ncbi:hypothetical protein [Alteromonas gracilis]|uniref:hypothetical protein n=1 Tax=Alteromonas gracilis TaxID=1479524 RepID=UPI0030CB24A4
MAVYFCVSKKAKPDQTFTTETLFYSVVTGFLAARIAFVIALWEVYQTDWLSAFDIRDGGKLLGNEVPAMPP